MEDSQTPANALEGESLEGTAASPQSAGPGPDAPQSDKKPPKKKGGGLFGRFSIYLLLFIFIVLIAVIVTVVSYLHSHSKTPNKIASQDLSQSSLSQLSSSNVTVGDAKQVLNVQSNAVFAGQVLVRSDLQVAGKLQIGGSLSLSNITVSGTALIDTAQVNKNFQVAGDTALQGQLTVQKGISINGGGTFNGPITSPQITTNTLQLNGDLTFTHHISAGGVTPNRSNGNALGGGGTASVSGSDTAGSIGINTGGNPSAGCLVTVTFATKFNTTPHVIITPVEAGAGALNYYVTRNTGSFTICSTNAPGASQSFGFDYIVFD